VADLEEQQGEKAQRAHVAQEMSHGRTLDPKVLDHAPLRKGPYEPKVANKLADAAESADDAASSESDVESGAGE
jgi:hypothetical protein